MFGKLTSPFAYIFYVNQDSSSQLKSTGSISDEIIIIRNINILNGYLLLEWNKPREPTLPSSEAPSVTQNQTIYLGNSICIIMPRNSDDGYVISDSLVTVWYLVITYCMNYLVIAPSLLTDNRMGSTLSSTKQTWRTNPELIQFKYSAFGQESAHEEKIPSRVLNRGTFHWTVNILTGLDT